jgi:4-hydroxy-4-methyl-2-oxoglutarate aldolase
MKPDYFALAANHQPQSPTGNEHRMSDKGLSAADLELLRKYDTPTICNVVELFELQPRNVGYMDARIKSCFPELPPMVGYAVTSTYRGAVPAREGDVYSALDTQVEAFSKVDGPPVVVVQDLDVPSAAATFGDVMCSCYKAFGAVGLITSGAARDLDQVRAMGFPAFSDGAICSHGYAHIVDLGVPVSLGGIIVFPGDLLHGDCNGVTVVPNEIGSEVAHACADFVAAEQVVIDYVGGHSPTPAGLATARAESTDLIKELGTRLKR